MMGKVCKGSVVVVLLLLVFTLVSVDPVTAAARAEQGKSAGKSADTTKADEAANTDAKANKARIVAPKRAAPAPPATTRERGRDGRGSAAQAGNGSAQDRELAIRDGRRGATQREMMREKKLLPKEQKAAGRRLRQQQAEVRHRLRSAGPEGLSTMAGPSPCADASRRCGLPGGTPDYFGTTPNWAYSPLPRTPITGVDVLWGGSGYSQPAISITDAYGRGSEMTGDAVLDGSGAITEVVNLRFVNPDGAVAEFVAPVLTVVDPTGVDAWLEPVRDTTQVTGGLRKFVDTLPGLGPAAANNFGAYIPVATPDTITYPGSDYYEIEVVEYQQLFHSDLCTQRDAGGQCTGGLTTLRGYRQTNLGTDEAGQNTIAPPERPFYLGPLIVSQRDRPVRIKMVNNLPTGPDGNLFIPVDATVMGAGPGPDGGFYTQNRAALHLHGGRTPWISDGTAHQWFTPAGEDTPYTKGESLQNVPDMPDPGPGAQTLYWTNQQSSRLLFYHDHSMGITRLNVYVGEAAGLVLRDDVENKLVADGILPAREIPLIVQTKTFVDPYTIDKTDPTWNWGTGAFDAERDGLAPVAGDLWYPHVYVPAQNPYDITGINATGRWAYGPWFWPPTPVCGSGPNAVPPACVEVGPVDNPWYQEDCGLTPPGPGCTQPWEPPTMPGTPNVSWAAEAFLDTPTVNGVAYPTVTLEPKAYRLRVLNADNDRMFNLQLYVADPNTLGPGGVLSEVKMVPASRPLRGQPGWPWPSYWPSDARDGGVPDPQTAGPDWIVVGSEGGFLPTPVVVKQKPMIWNNDPTTFNAGNVDAGALMLAPAERADVVVDFSRFAGKTLILYNDAPAPWPALDPHYDYYTFAPDNTAMGGAPMVLPGYGPNTRTIMQIKVAQATPDPAYNLAALNSAFRHDDARTGNDPVTGKPLANSVFENSQDEITVGQSAYDAAYGVTFPATAPDWGIARIYDTAVNFQTVEGAKSETPPPAQSITMTPKAIHDEMGGVFDSYGRLSAKLGLEILGANAQTQNFVMQGFADPATEILNPSIVPDDPLATMVKIGETGDGTQIWKITHNGVDTHPIHFHLMDVQVLNRVGWDGFIRLPWPEEYGWKETVRISPLEDTMVAMRPYLPKVPFGLPNSRRHLEPALPDGATEGFTNLDPVTGQPLAQPTQNFVTDFGWEYTWHCHILAHEENDMMRPVSFTVPAYLPGAPTALAVDGTTPGEYTIRWADATPAADPATLGNLSNEIGFEIWRSTGFGEPGTFDPILGPDGQTPLRVLANETTFTDAAPPAGSPYALFYQVRAINEAGGTDSAPVAANPLAAPTVAALTPTTGPAAGGTLVTLTGTGFVDGATVLFGETSVPATFVSETELQATSPAAAVDVDTPVTVSVRNPDRQLAAAPEPFTYLVPPTVTAVAPAEGSPNGGDAVTITGTDFRAGATVTFGGTPATAVVVVSATQITAVTPAGLEGPAAVVVTNPDGQGGTLADGFFYVFRLVINGIAPNAGPMPGGTTVTITGHSFLPADSLTVTFGTATAAVQSVTESTIVVLAPAGPGGVTDTPVDVTVSQPAAEPTSTTAAGGFTYVAPPTLASIAPDNGTAGNAVTLTGTNFVAGASVTFDGAAATNVVVVDAATITATVPAHAVGTAEVVVTNPDGQPCPAPRTFTYNPKPTVTAINPQSGPLAGGTPVTITGTGFLPGATVTLGTVPATGVVVVSATQVTAVTGTAATAATVDVHVTNADGQRGTLAQGYRYNDVNITVSSVTNPSGAAPGATISVSDRVSVTGAGTTPPTVTHLFLSPVNVLDGRQVYLGFRNVPSTRGGSSNTGSTNVIVPASTVPGNYFIIALGDATNVAIERNETDNAFASAIAIGPDLTVSALTTPRRAPVGSTISITDTTYNPSQTSSAASSTAFYLSADNAFSAGDVLLGSRSVPALGSRQTNTGTTSVVIPATTARGNYYIIAVADNGNAVAEYNETNNTRANSFQAQ